MSDRRAREDALEELLGRATPPADVPEPRADCPDAETLAAWADAGLEPTRRATVEAHVAACTRCLAIAGALVRSQPDAVAERAPAWTGWLVPVAAAAAVVLVVVTLPRDRLPPPVAMRAMQEQVAAPPADADQLARQTEDRSGAAAALLDEVGRRRADSPTRQERAASADALVVGQALTANEALASPPFRLREGQLERSLDAGATWTIVETGVEGEFEALVAPSPQVCWVVGRAGLAIRTTDGQTWRRLTLPVRTDLSSVAADDGLSAVVTTVDGRRFRTTDGGETWIEQGVQDS